MTTPSEVAIPRINRDNFQKAIDKLMVDAKGLEIKTRSEVKLEAEELELQKLEAEGREIRSQLETCKALIEQLEEIKGVFVMNEADNAVARGAVLSSIDSLRKAGVAIGHKDSGDGQ